MSKMKIKSLEIQNVKKIKAIEMECAASGLTVIGGGNGQGKTSVIDAIAFALGGKRYMPTGYQREGSVADPVIKVTMENGLVVERKGKNASLKITDPAGQKSGQQLLNSFVSELAINLPKFMNASNSERTNILLSILGIGDELRNLEVQEKRFYDERHTVGQIADRKKKHAEELPCFDGVPNVPVTASQLIKDQQDILARNGENQRKRENLLDLKACRLRAAAQVEEFAEKHALALASYNKLTADVATAEKSSAQLNDESTAEIEAKLNDIENVNAKVRSNLDKSHAEDEFKENKAEYDDLSGKISAVRQERIDLLNGADLPLDGLSVDGGELVYGGQKWDCMSGSEQLRVGTAIAQKLNPECGFVLIDKAEQFDADTLAQFGEYLHREGLQAICTRVSSGDECSIIIEDGKAVVAEAPKFNAGQF